MRKSIFTAFALIAAFSLVMVSCNSSKKDDKGKGTDTTTIAPDTLSNPDTTMMHDTTGSDTTGKGEQVPPPK